ncbi:MAG TPA: hypothetical protein VM283_01405, partial [Armatimonadota bacterium]|nr:hypothetical protein [Armatimonadota bacterium]
GVSGISGLLNNVRTDQGLLIQQLSINEEGVHQVSVGRTQGEAWGGVHLIDEQPGSEYTIEATGGIINYWQERIEARALPSGADQIHLAASRTLDQGPKRLRTLMYVAEWLEAERNSFVIRTPDGALKSEDAGEPLWFGMPPRSNEAGLGPYRVLGEFPAGTEIVVPMLSRGETMTVRCDRPAKISGFRFEIYFRGLWFEATDNSAAALDFTVTVEPLPRREVGPMTVFSDDFSGATTLTAGGIPLLGRIQPLDGSPTPEGAWSWSDGEATGTLRLPAGSGGVTMRAPEYLRGASLSVHPPGGEAFDRVGDVPLRLGAEMGPVELATGARLEFSPSAIERMSLTTAAPATLQLSCTDSGLAMISLQSPGAPTELTVRYQRVTEPSPDLLASRPVAYGSEPEPGPYSGLSVVKDVPARGDVTVRTPWWEVVHSAAQGGAITSVTFANGTRRNLLVEPIATRVVAGETYTDTADASPQIEVLEDTPSLVRVRVRGRLMSEGGRALCPFEHLYEYRPMLVRRTCSYELGAGPVQCTRLSVGSMRLGWWLDEAVTRRANHRTTWHRAVFPGPPVFEETGFSQYMCLFQRGVEGIDWVPASDLDQWWGFGTGEPGRARYAIHGDGAGNPVMEIEPLAAGQPVALSGTLRFESYLSLPQVKRCLLRRNFVACLDNGECTEDFLRMSADYGVTDIMLGAGNTPGSFELSDLQDCRRSVERAAEFGMKVYPFDPFQLVSRRAPIWEHHEEWGREELVNGKPELRIYSSYGDYFCPTAGGFRDALKQGYTQLVESANFGGLYHDFTHPYVCYNTRHW